jgi:hypothetical protein
VTASVHEFSKNQGVTSKLGARKITCNKFGNEDPQILVPLYQTWSLRRPDALDMCTAVVQINDVEMYWVILKKNFVIESEVRKVVLVLSL